MTSLSLGFSQMTLNPRYFATFDICPLCVYVCVYTEVIPFSMIATASVWIFVLSQNSYVEKLMPKVMILGAGVLRSMGGD